ncbi:O-antigen ligase family protein, partial [Bacillaceae bacterium Marseille-Q3522]|nr:O-antigen ligase family protein [Bacillaceae bacterium Marseille-Q3522]
MLKNLPLNQNTIVAACLVSALFASVNTIVLFSPLILILTFFVMIFTSVISRKKWTNFFPDLVHNYNSLPLYILILYIYTVISTLVSGVPLKEFFTYDFYRNEGNFFYSFSPLLLLIFMGKHSLNVEKILKVFVWVVPYIFFVFNLALSIPFFLAHNAFGGFMGIVSLVNIILLKNDKKLLLALIPNLALLYYSDSRGSLIGVLLAVVIYYLYKLNFKKIRRLFFISLIGSLAFIYIEGYMVWNASNRPVAPTLEEAIEYSDNLQLDSATEQVFSYIERSYTIVHRVYFYWPVAMDLFFRSPIFGIGFSRYDDVPHNIESNNYLFAINNSDAVLHTNYHAHNSYLHILAETGIVGLLLFFFIFRSFIRVAKKFTKNIYSDIVYILLTYI